MDNTSRDFNTFAKIILVLSMIVIIKSIITNVLRISINSYFGANNDVVIIEIIINVLILVSAIMTLLKKRYGLIALIVLFVVRMFATIRAGGDISYSYQLGGKLAFFLRDFGLFAIAMCFKKDGISGWKSMLGPSTSQKTETSIVEDESANKSIGREIEKIVSDTDNLSHTDIEPVNDEYRPKYLCSVYMANTEQKETTNIDSPEISDDCATINNTKEPSKKKSKFGLFQLSGVVILFIAAITLIMIVVTKDYPKNIDRFGDKFKYCLSLPNNRLSKVYFSKYQKATEGGLEELRKEYLETAWRANPNKEDLLDSLSKAFFSLGKKSDEFYHFSEEVCLKMLKKNPSNKVALSRIARVYFNTGLYEKAYKIGEQLLIDDPQNSLGIDLMCRKYYYLEDWDNLVKWGRKGYELGKENTLLWAEITYLYSKGLYESGKHFDAVKYYYEAEKVDKTSWLHDRFSFLTRQN